MTYYSREGRRGLFPGPRQQLGYPPNPRRQFGYPPMPRQQFGYQPMPRQRYGFPAQNAFPQQREYFIPNNQQNPAGTEQWQQPFYPNQQMPNQGNAGLPDNLNTLMGHVGTITNGINMMRQFGSVLGLFRL